MFLPSGGALWAPSSQSLLPPHREYLTPDGNCLLLTATTDILLVRKRKEGMTPGENSGIKERTSFRMGRLAHVYGVKGARK